MSLTILLSIFSLLLTERKTTAPKLAEKYKISERTVYRYISALSSVLPLFVRRGRGGGIFLSDTFLLPAFLTEEEHEATLDALLSAYERTAEPRFLSAKRKLTSARSQTPPLRPEGGEILLLPHEHTAYAKNLRAVQAGVCQKRVLHLLYGAEGKKRTVEPHALLFEQNEWYVYAFCYDARDFCLLSVEEIHGVLSTEEVFRPRV